MFAEPLIYSLITAPDGVIVRVTHVPIFPFPICEYAAQRLACRRREYEIPDEDICRAITDGRPNPHPRYPTQMRYELIKRTHTVIVVVEEACNPMYIRNIMVNRSIPEQRDWWPSSPLPPRQ